MKANFQKVILAVLAITAVACSSPKQLLKNENFDASITKAIKKVRGAGDRAKLKNLATVGEAFYEANERNLISIQSLESANRPENWKTINSLYNRIIARQNKVAPYVAQAAELGIDLSGNMVDYNEAELDSRKRAAFHEYKTAEDLIALARSGDKISARRAYNRLVEIDRYFHFYKDKELLKSEAIELGREDIFVSVDNRSQAIIPRRLGDRILDFGIENLNDLFHTYYTRPDAGVEYDYELKINILDMIVTPESERFDSYVDTKEVEDGFDYVLDENGNVLKDTSGNDIKVDKFKTIRATIEEIRQFKAVALAGNVEYYDRNGNRVLRTESIQAEAVFENFAATYRGDRDALTNESRRKIGNAPVPFPATELMLEDAIDLIRPNILRTIQNIKAG